MATFNSIISDIKTLSEKGLEKLRSYLIGSPVCTASSLEKTIAKERFNAGRVCPYCGSFRVRRNGKRRDGVQKYFCADCHKHFVAATKSIAQGTRKDIAVWTKYIECRK